MTESQALTRYEFTIAASIPEWLTSKENRTGSQKTRRSYQDALASFRAYLSLANLDLLDNPIDVARVAPLWAGSRLVSSKRPSEQVAPSTFNQRLAVLSSWYSFVAETYHLQIENPIKTVKKRPVQAYAAALPIDSDLVEIGLDAINRKSPEGLRDYAILAIALATGRRAAELVGLRGKDIRMAGKRGQIRITLTFHCKGNKIMRDQLDIETSAVVLDYLHSIFGRDLLQIDQAAAIWQSCSRRNPGQAISQKTLARICERYLDTSKVHALRHTFSVGMIRSGAPITDLANRLGHTDIKITQIYTKEIMGEENPYSEKLSQRFGIKRRKS